MRSLLLAPLFLLTAAAPADERSFMVGSFERVRVDGPFEVEIVIGSPRATAIGERGSLDQVAVELHGDTLVVSPGAFAQTSDKGTVPMPKVRVSVPTLRSVTINGAARVRVAAMRGARIDLMLSGAGSLDVSAIKADEINANLTGTGAITLAGTAGKAALRNYGAGSIEADALTVGDARLLSNSSGNISVHVRYTAKADATGSGGIIISGKPECTLRGPGPIECLGTIRRE